MDMDTHALFNEVEVQDRGYADLSFWLQMEMTPIKL